MNLDYQELYKVEGGSSLGIYGLKILVAAHPRLEEGEKEAPKINLEHDLIRNAMYDAESKLRDAVLRVMVLQSPSWQQRGVDARVAMLSCFGEQPIFVEDLPNQYCHDYCCSMLQWHNVTTRVGVITLGPRKRVINIDWTKTKDTKTAEELFPHEKVTKGDRSIHAWTIDKARAYVSAIMSGVPLPAEHPPAEQPLPTEQNATVST